MVMGRAGKRPELGQGTIGRASLDVNRYLTGMLFASGVRSAEDIALAVLGLSTLDHWYANWYGMLAGVR